MQDAFHGLTSLNRINVNTTILTGFKFSLEVFIKSPIFLNPCEGSFDATGFFAMS